MNGQDLPEPYEFSEDSARKWTELSKRREYLTPEERDWLDKHEQLRKSIEGPQT